MSLAVFFLSIAPAFLVLALIFINQQRFFEKDLGLYLFKLLICCLITMQIALRANMILLNETELNFKTLDEKNQFYAAFAGIGFNEEMAKLVPILFLLYFSNRWKNRQDVFFSCVFVGAFFAAFENLFVPQYNYLLGSLLIRSLIAVPAHLSFGCIMAYFVYMLLKCSDKAELTNQKLRTGAISWFLQMVLFGKLANFYYKFDSSNSTYLEYFFKGGIGLFIFLLIFELILLVFAFKKFKWLLNWNLRLSYALLALIIPACLHGLHDWGCTRFTGTQLLNFYLCLLFTYLSIILGTYFLLNKQAQVNLNHVIDNN